MSRAAKVLALIVGIALAGVATAHEPTTPAPPAPPPAAGGDAHQHGGFRHDHRAAAAGEPHLHAPVPPEYRAAHVPSAAWTSRRLLARGKEIYAARCAVCHGDEGDGNGPAATGVPLKPASFRDVRMVSEMAGNYWFWRVSEGGLVEPFKSMGSVMPAWKDELAVEDRWAVIAYTHTFSGHAGPHVTSEHPEMLAPGHGQHGAAGPGTTLTPAATTPAHKH